MTPVSLPPGFRAGHWTHDSGRTGCTVILTPPGTRGGVDIRGGGTGTVETEGLSPLANSEGPHAVLLSGGSAFGLAAAAGVMRWLTERGIGRPMHTGVVPHVPAAVIFDLTESPHRPGPEGGYAACQAATGATPERGRVGAGAGAAVGKVRGREHASPGGVGLAADTLADGTIVAALAVANAFGDVIGPDGAPLAGAHDEQGRLARSAALIPATPLPPFRDPSAQATTLVCVCTDAPLDKRGCAIVARTAGAGVARAVDPAFTQADGDVVFCLASGPRPYREPGPESTWGLIALGTAAANVTAAAIRDAVG